MTPEEALVASDSSDWQERSQAARVLAGCTDDASAAALGGLLLDGQVDDGNWAVVIEATQALLQRNDIYGAELVFSIVAIASAQTNVHQLWEISVAADRGTFQIDHLAPEIEQGTSARARAGLAL